MLETQPTCSSSFCLLAVGIQLSTATCSSGVYTLRLLSKWEKAIAHAYEPDGTHAPRTVTSIPNGTDFFDEPFHPYCLHWNHVWPHKICNIEREEPDTLQKNWLVCGVHYHLPIFCLLLSSSVWSPNLWRFEKSCSVYPPLANELPRPVLNLYLTVTCNISLLCPAEYSPLFPRSADLVKCVWCQVWFCPVDVGVRMGRRWRGSGAEWWSEQPVPFSSDHTLLCNRLVSEQKQRWDAHKGQHQSRGLFICLGP